MLQNIEFKFWRKKPGDEEFWASFKFPRLVWDQRLVYFNRFSYIETRSSYSGLVLYLHGLVLFAKNFDMLTSNSCCELKKSVIWSHDNTVSSTRWKLWLFKLHKLHIDIMSIAFAHFTMICTDRGHTYMTSTQKIPILQNYHPQKRGCSHATSL